MIDLKLGDVHELIKTLPDHSVNLVLADPPYGISAAKDKWDSPLNWDVLWPEINRVLAPHGAIALFSASKFTFEIVNTNFRNYRYKYTWVKNFSTGFLNASRLPLKRSEDVCIFYKNQPTYNPQRYETDKPAIVIRDKKEWQRQLYRCSGEIDRVRTYDNTRLYDDVLFFDAEPISGRLHPSQKPIALLEHFIKTYTNEGQTVLDFCMGSGSTGVAAVKNKRNFIGFELYKEYFDIAQDRISTEPISLIQELTTKGKADEQTTC